MTDIIWQDPPPPKKGRQDGEATKSYIAALQSRPGQWAKYPERRSVAFAYGIKRSAPGHIEATSRNHADDADGKRRCDWWFRWVES